jgi:glucokinase
MRVGSSTGILRLLNEQAILDAVIGAGSLTRADLSRNTGLSKPTVSQTVAWLEEAGLLAEVGRVEGRQGRVGTLYGLNSAVGSVAGVDLGAHRISAAISDMYGEILTEGEEPTDERGGPHVLEQIAALVGKLRDGLDSRFGRVVAVGLASPGVFDRATNRFRLVPNVPGWDQVDVVGGLAERLDAVIEVENDVNLAAIGEKWRGIGAGISNFVFITLGTGVGMGVIIDNQLYRGASGAAGEIAYLPLGPHPFDPAEQERGAFENQAADGGIMQRAREQAPDLQVTQPRDLFALAEGNNSEAQELIEEEARWLGLGIASVIATLDPALVVLGGGIGRNHILLEPIRRTLHQLLPAVPRVETSILGSRASLLGAVSVALLTARSRLHEETRPKSEREANRVLLRRTAG